MKAILRSLALAGLLSVWLALPVQASHEASQQSAHHENLQSIVTRSQAALRPARSSTADSYSDELWLIGSFLVSLTGLVILVRYLRH